MNPEDAKKFNINGTQYTVTYRTSGWRKRQIIDSTLNELHEQQLQMIDEAVEHSDLQQAKDLIDYIRNK